MSIVHMPEAISGLVGIILEGTDEARQHAAGAIAHLAVNEEAESIIARSDGVVNALASLLLTGSEGAKEEAAAALENLSYSADSAMLVAQTETVIAGLAMLLHTAKGKGIEKAIGTMQNLAVMADCRVEIASAPRALVGISNVLWSGSPRVQVSPSTLHYSEILSCAWVMLIVRALSGGRGSDHREPGSEQRNPHKCGLHRWRH